MSENHKKIKTFLIILMIFSTILSAGLQFFQKNSGQVEQVAEIQDVYKINNGYIYFGRPTCPSCRLFEPILKLITEERHIKINYFNSDYFRKENKASDEELMKVFEKYEVVRIPLLAYIRDGKLYEAFGAELSGNKDQSMVYKEINDMLNNTLNGFNIRFEYISCIIIWIAVIISQFIMVKDNNLIQKMNAVLFLPLLTSCGLFALWYTQFQNSGLNLIKNDKFLTVMSSITIILVLSCYLKNRVTLTKERKYEKNI